MSLIDRIIIRIARNRGLILCSKCECKSCVPPLALPPPSPIPASFGNGQMIPDAKPKRRSQSTVSVSEMRVMQMNNLRADAYHHWRLVKDGGYDLRSHHSPYVARFIEDYGDYESMAKANGRVLRDSPMRRDYLLAKSYASA